MIPEQIERFRAGDPLLFRECVERESPRLLAYAFRLTGDGDAAADLVQDTWVTAFRKRESLAKSGTLSGWLIAICRSLHLSARRSDEKRAARERTGRDGQAGGIGPEAVRVLEETDRKRRIAAALGDLPPQQRDVLTLRLLEDRSTRETAERLGIAEGTVKATLHHAIRRMRALLEEQEDDDCPDPDTLATLCGALGWNAEEGVLHVASCELCREQLRLLGSLHAVMAEEMPVPAELQAAILDALRAETGEVAAAPSPLRSDHGGDWRRSCYRSRA